MTGAATVIFAAGARMRAALDMRAAFGVPPRERMDKSTAAGDQGTLVACIYSLREPLSLKKPMDNPRLSVL